MSAIETLILSSSSPVQTEAIAAAVARHCRAGCAVALIGDLGAGKTTFARGFISALCAPSEPIVSPTFTLAQPYAMPGGGAVWHFDFYRMKSAAEARETGLEEALQSGISLIEWPELVMEALPEETLNIEITHAADDDARSLRLSGRGELWHSCFNTLKEIA